MSDTDSDYRFGFYERLRIVGKSASLDPIRGELAAVLGRAVGDDGPSYAVFVYSTDECWDVGEADLEQTGEFDRRETFYDDSEPSLRISPDGKMLGFNQPR